VAEPRRPDPGWAPAAARPDLSRPLRFCLLTTFYPPESFGGDAIFVRQLAHELAARGHEVDVVHHPDAYWAVAGRPFGGGAPRARPAEPPGVRVHALSAGAGALEPLLMHQTGRPVLLARRLRELLGRGFDVVHFHNASLVGAPEVLGWGGGALTLYTTHEAWLVCPTHVLFKYGRRPCEKPTCAACSIAHGRPPQPWRATGRLARGLAHVDAFLAPSASIARLHRERGLELPFVHLPSFVPDRGEPPAAAPRADARPSFLFAGRLERAKGPQTLLELFARLPEADLVVAGAGALEGELRRAAPPNVRLVGRLEEAELVAAYRAARAVVVPSLCHEVFPLVALEALREATPVAVARHGALPELIAESGAGVVYDDADGLLAVLRRWIAEPAEAARLGERGRAAWRERWAPGRHLDRYLELVRSLLAGRAERRAT
jgi:glycosyltransferase involved in cell wall biosynthesis